MIVSDPVVWLGMAVIATGSFTAGWFFRNPNKHDEE